MKNLYLGIDTSNYRTSAAVVDSEGIILTQKAVLLDVPEGKRGLRQSEVFFMHSNRLPGYIEEIFGLADPVCIKAIGVSERPRRIEGSYMPCFLAGVNAAREIAAALKVPVYCFSHQEGHIQAIKSYTEMADMDEFLACHFSGGTCEVLHIKGRDYDPYNLIRGNAFQWIHGEGAFYDVNIIGGSKDISFGQVLDRAGVAMGFSFPSGKQLDEIALKTRRSTSMLTPIKVIDGQINLSGIDTQIKNKIQSLSMSRSR